MIITDKGNTMEEPTNEPTSEAPATTAQAEPAVAPTKDDMNMAMLAHLLGIFTGFLGPLIIWLVKKEDSAFIEEAGREALNFQITLLIVYVVLGIFGIFTCGLGSLLIFPVWIVALVFMILATLAATKGEAYQYPACLRLVK